MPTILIVDDRPANREFLMTLLGYGGHRLLEAADGDEALAIVRQERPDLVVTDILMPTTDGYEFVRQLRADPAVAATPVIFCTAHYHEPEARNLAAACGVRYVLGKPCEPEAVLRTVAAALGWVASSPAPAPAGFSGEHLRLVTTKLFQKAEELRLSNGRLKALVDFGLQLGSERDLPRLLQTFCDTAREILGARHAVAAVLYKDHTALRHFMTSGMDADTVQRLGSPDSRVGPHALVLREGRCLRRRNPGGDPTALGFAPRFPPIHCWLGAPIASPARVYGWLDLIDKLGAAEFSDEDERLAGILAAQFGRVYENGSLYAESLRRADELREREERIRLLLESTGEAIYGIDADGVCTFCNRTCARLLGYAEPTWLLGKNVHALIHHTRPDGSPCAEEDCPIVQACRRGAPAHGEDEYFWRADGSCIPVEFWCHPVRRQDAVVGAVVTFMDISERKQLEERFRQAQKMEAVGRLAGGVAHDFNNLLTVITGYGDLILSRLTESDPVRELVGEMVAAGNRAAGLTRQLLAFSRKTILEPRILDLKAVVADVDRMLRRLIGEDIHLSFLSDPDTGTVKADPGQIEQMLLNLTVNARDAMPQGGQLTIEVRNAHLDETAVGGDGDVRPGPYVLLAVSDTGCGMPPAVLERIWEPFFTTKGEAGTGLGLATVYGIVKRSGGHVTVSSIVGAGTTFRIYLPRLDQPATVERPQAAPAVPPRGEETVLLAEDEDAVRALVRHVLQGCGYTVLEGRDGAEALRVARRHQGPIALLVTDVVMPRLSGREVAERLTAMYPGLKVLFLSGYTDDAVMRHGIQEAEVHFLQKPFSPAALVRKVREVLEGR
jgi:PAS domain S-box-containing protein